MAIAVPGQLALTPPGLWGTGLRLVPKAPNREPCLLSGFLSCSVLAWVTLFSQVNQAINQVNQSISQVSQPTNQVN